MSTGADKNKLRAETGKYKLEIGAGKYKLRAVNTNWGPGPGLGPGKHKYPWSMVNTSCNNERGKEHVLYLIKMVANEKLHDFFLYKIISNYCYLHKQMLLKATSNRLQNLKATSRRCIQNSAKHLKETEAVVQIDREILKTI